MSDLTNLKKAIKNLGDDREGVDEKGYWRIDLFSGDKKYLDEDFRKKHMIVEKKGILNFIKNLLLFNFGMCHGKSQQIFFVYERNNISNAKEKWKIIPRQYRVCKECLDITPINVEGILKHRGLIMEKILMK